MGKGKKGRKMKQKKKKKDSLHFSGWRELVEPIITTTSSSSCCFFLFHLLPLHIQEHILSLLPVSTLIRCTTVSHSFRSLIQSLASTCTPYQLPTSTSSQTDVNFLLFSEPTATPSFAYSYNPTLNRWSTSLHYTIPKSRFVFDSTLSFICSQPNPFDASIFDIPSNELESLESLDQLMLHGDDTNTTILDPFTGSTSDLLSLQWDPFISNQTKFDSRPLPPQLHRALAEKERLYGRLFTLSFESVFLHGKFFFAEKEMPNVLAFNPVSWEWHYMQRAMPSLACVIYLVFDGRMFMVAGEVKEEGKGIAGVGIWEVDFAEMQCRQQLFCSMPDKLFRRFRGSQLSRFKTVHRKGKICFYNCSTSAILMVDLSTKRWWWPPPIPSPLSGIGVGRLYDCWIGHAVEPHIDLLKKLVGREDFIGPDA